MFKLKRKTKRILAIVLIVGVLVGAVAGIVALTGRDKADKGFDLVNVDFDRGGLNAKGNHVDTKASIYTKEAFECGESIRVKIDFDSDVIYEIYFYDESDDFVQSTGEFSKTETVDAPDGATHARLVVTPDWDTDVDDDDQVIRFWQKNKYAKQITVMIAPAEEAEAAE
ncbi:MAG: hypothetical protein E7673_02945 [Ruminococcaceae bacterium]|nr:hypothetical protein [Oscillospiraceae bacterium]